MRRLTWNLEHGASRIELILDAGSVTGGGRRELIMEAGRSRGAAAPPSRRASLAGRCRFELGVLTKAGA